MTGTARTLTNKTITRTQHGQLRQSAFESDENNPMIDAVVVIYIKRLICEKDSFRHKTLKALVESP